MDRKLKIHAIVLVVLVLWTMFAWDSTKSDPEGDARESNQEATTEDAYDPYAELRRGREDERGFAEMVKVGVPLLLTMVYAGFLGVFYVLPMFVDRVGEEMMGSNAEVEKDPLYDARAAVAAGEYAEAIQEYRKVWLGDREDRFPIGEMAKIQRNDLKSPVVAVSTLQEALDDHEWPEDDAAFLMFRMVEIYEDDLEDEERVIEILKQVTEKLEGTRHAGNAAHKLREMGAV